jgi:uncharacterized protein (TIGR03435 family)
MLGSGEIGGRKVMKAEIGVGVVLAVLLPWGIFGQAVASRSEFEVASVKPSDPQSRAPIGVFTGPGGRVTITNFTLKMLVSEAYSIKEAQVFGGERWVGDVPFDIVAKAPASSDAAKITPPSPKTPPTPEVLTMLRNLLAERFQLKVDQTTQQRPVYELVVAKAGPKLQETQHPNDPPRWQFGEGVIAARNRPSSWLADALARQVDRPVLDKTGLRGTYDFNLAWDSTHMSSADADSGGGPAGSFLPSLFTALQQQLGLKLVATKGSVVVLDIRQATKPLRD